MTSTTPFGSGHDVGRARPEVSWNLDLRGLRPLVEVRVQVADLGEGEADLGDVRLDGGLAQIGAERGGDVGLPLGEESAELPELRVTADEVDG